MTIPIRGRLTRALAHGVVALLALGLTAWSAIVVKEATVSVPLVETGGAMAPRVLDAVRGEAVGRATDAAGDAGAFLSEAVPLPARVEAPSEGTIRWFDGRRVRAVKTIWMRVTAYSPDARSCGIYADGQTATLHSVWTNAMRLVAADTRVLPYRSMITVPGYAGDEIVPVLDCGGAIKGMRLDVLMPTHEIALKWGVRDLPITVWAYDDED
jgi:3D (Asp-Asp-Asp) domain-containing protein